MDHEKLVRVYLKIRERRSALKRAFEEEDRALRASQDKLEVALLASLNATGAQSVKTGAGTFYKQTDLKPSGSDWNALYRWIAENDAFDALERRIKKGFIVDYMEEHDGDLPPGVSVHRESVVRVRKGA